jgi:predicted membrane protein
VGPDGDINLENVNGAIDLLVPGDINATFYVETMMGGIDNDFGQEPERESRWVPSQELRFRNGNGSADIHVETLQGGVSIRRQ